MGSILVITRHLRVNLTDIKIENVLDISLKSIYESQLPSKSVYDSESVSRFTDLLEKCPHKSRLSKFQGTSKLPHHPKVSQVIKNALKMAP